MKKLLAAVLILCLSIPCAFSEADYDGAIFAFAAEYNLNAKALFGLPEISTECDKKSPDNYEEGMIAYWVDGGCIIGVEMNEEWYGYGAVLAMGTADGGEFLARCANVMYILEGLDTSNYAQLLYAYFQVRSNKKTCDASLSTGGQISMSYENGYWQFFIFPQF